MSQDLSMFCVSLTDTLREVASCIERNDAAIALVAAEGRLLGTLTDGDVRRALLDGLKLDTSVERALAQREDRYGSTLAVTAPPESTPAMRLELLRKHQIRQLPLVDAEGLLCGLAVLEDLLPELGPELSLEAVIMAGGFGTRLHPLTEDTPKPMLAVGDRPLLEHTLGQLRESGIRRVSITTHYQEEKIVSHFGDGSEHGLELDYVAEESPLGTAGSLRLLGERDEPLLVMNGDILTRVDFRAMLDFHREHNALITLAVREYDFRVPYGVVKSEGPFVRGMSEKPVQAFFVNAGIYLLEPSVRAYLPESERFDMPDLIERVLDAGLTVVSFPIHEYWLDIGEHANYRQAQVDTEQGGKFHK